MLVYVPRNIPRNPLIGFVELRCLEDQNLVSVIRYVLRANKLVDTGETTAEDVVCALLGRSQRCQLRMSYGVF